MRLLQIQILKSSLHSASFHSEHVIHINLNSDILKINKIKNICVLSYVLRAQSKHRFARFGIAFTKNRVDPISAPLNNFTFTDVLVFVVVKWL